VVSVLGIIHRDAEEDAGIVEVYVDLGELDGEAAKKMLCRMCNGRNRPIRRLGLAVRRTMSCAGRSLRCRTGDYLVLEGRQIVLRALVIV
jgi:hypothetical protein